VPFSAGSSVRFDTSDRASILGDGVPHDRTGAQSTPSEGGTVGLVLLLLLLALLIGGVGLFVEGLKWLLIIALVLFVISFFTGYRSRSRA
jgi:hypothetical protein